MRSAKQAGSRHEKRTAWFLAAALNDRRIEQRSRNGSKDRGDITGLLFHGMRVVVECKDCSKDEIPRWLREAEAERGNDDALVGIVVQKVGGIGEETLEGVGRQRVIMTLHDFAVLCLGSREEVEANLAAAERRMEADRERRVSAARERARAIGPDLDEFDDQEDE